MDKQFEKQQREDRKEREKQLAKDAVEKDPLKYLIPAFIKHYSEIMAIKFPEIGSAEQIEEKINENARTEFLKEYHNSNSIIPDY